MGPQHPTQPGAATNYDRDISKTMLGGYRGTRYETLNRKKNKKWRAYNHSASRRSVSHHRNPTISGPAHTGHAQPYLYPAKIGINATQGPGWRSKSAVWNNGRTHGFRGNAREFNDTVRAVGRLGAEGSLLRLNQTFFPGAALNQRVHTHGQQYRSYYPDTNNSQSQPEQDLSQPQSWAASHVPLPLAHGLSEAPSLTGPPKLKSGQHDKVLNTNKTRIEHRGFSKNREQGSVGHQLAKTDGHKQKRTPKVRFVKSAPGTAQISPVRPELSSDTPTPFCEFTPLFHKEKMAILVMEKCSDVLMEEAKDQSAETRTDEALLSPIKCSLLARMKFVFARVMAFARLEAVSNRPHRLPFMEWDVMGALEAERFLAAIFEVRGQTSASVVYRRYFRVTDSRLQGSGVGAVLAAAGSRTVDTIKSVREKMEEVASCSGKVHGRLLAEVEVNADGTTGEIWWNDSTNPACAEQWARRKFE